MQIPLSRPRHPQKAPGEMVDAQGSVRGCEQRGADIALLLSKFLYTAAFSCGGGAVCDQGQEEVGEGCCRVVGPRMERGRWKVQPEPQQELWESSGGAHTPGSLSPQKGTDHSITRVGRDHRNFLLHARAQRRVSYNLYRLLKPI